MSTKLSRRTLARYVVAEYANGRALGEPIDEVAAYLIETRRTREAELVVRTILDELATHGTVVATVTTAQQLKDSVRKQLIGTIDADTVHMREVIDPGVIGGVIIETPGSKLDASIRHKLARLREAKL